MDRDTIIAKAYENLKDVINCADNGEPYTRNDVEWTKDLVGALNDLRTLVPADKLQALGEDAEERLPRPDPVTLTIDRNDLGQIIDGLTARAELYDETERHFNGEVILGEIAECNDAEEAHAIAEHYRKIIAQLESAR